MKRSITNFVQSKNAFIIHVAHGKMIAAQVGGKWPQLSVEMSLSILSKKQSLWYRMQLSLTNIAVSGLEVNTLVYLASGKCVHLKVNGWMERAIPSNNY